MLFSTFITYAEPDYEVSGEELKYDEDVLKTMNLTMSYLMN